MAEQDEDPRNDVDPSVVPEGVELLLLARFDCPGPRNCRDCDTAPGGKHLDGCDKERCTVCMGQRLQCPPDDCLMNDDGSCDHCGESNLTECATNSGACKAHDKSKARWNGFYPGVLEAIKLGFFCYEDPSRSTGEYWVRCGPDHPKAIPDMNRLAIYQQTEGRRRR